MPLLIIGLVFAFVFMAPTIAQAYFNGVETPIEVCPIGDFGCVLERAASVDWLAMKAAALADGVTLAPDGPNSAFRSPEQQAALRASEPNLAAAVGHSPHQMGIAVDVNLKLGGDPLSWLQANAISFNFYPLPNTGAVKEPWHWEHHV